MPLAKLALESTLKVAFHGGRADAFAAAQAAAVDAVQMLAEDHRLERFARTLARLNPWKALAEVASAVVALKFRGFQLEDAVPEPPVLMPHAPHIASFIAQPVAATVRTRYESRVSGRDVDRPTPDLYISNLVIGQS